MSGFVALFIHSSVIVTSLDPGFIRPFFFCRVLYMSVLKRLSMLPLLRSGTETTKHPSRPHASFCDLGVLIFWWCAHFWCSCSCFGCNWYGSWKVFQSTMQSLLRNPQPADSLFILITLLWPDGMFTNVTVLINKQFSAGSVRYSHIKAGENGCWFTSALIIHTVSAE